MCVMLKGQGRDPPRVTPFRCRGVKQGRASLTALAATYLPWGSQGQTIFFYV